MTGLLAAMGAIPHATAQAPCVALVSGRCPGWSARYDGPASEADTAEALAVSPDGELLFVAGWRTTGASLTSHDTDFGVVAYDARTGAERWVAGYSGPGDGTEQTDGAADVAVSDDGDLVFATGLSTGAETFYDYATVALDARTGMRRWVARYAGPSDHWDNVEAITTGSFVDGGQETSLVFVTGWSTQWMNPGGHVDSGTTIAYDAATGREVWRATDEAGAPQWRDVTFTIDANGVPTVVVTGSRYSEFGTVDYSTAAYDARTGAQRWINRYDGYGTGDTFTSGSYPWSIVASPDGEQVVLTGETVKADLNEGFSSDIATIAYDVATGTRSWVARYDDPAGGEDKGTAVAIDPGGRRAFVVGLTPSERAGNDIVVVAYDMASGTAVWTARRAVPDRASPFAITASPDGERVVVAASAATGPLVLSYDAATGTPAWSGVLGPDAFAGAYAIGVSPDSSLVYAAGSTTSVTSESDFLTLAYDA